MTDDEQRGAWAIEKRLSIGILFALLIQGGGAVWYASKLDSRIAALEIGYDNLASATKSNYQFHIDQRVRVWERINEQTVALNEFRADLAGIDARLEYITRSLDRLTAISDRERESDRNKAKP